MSEQTTQDLDSEVRNDVTDAARRLSFKDCLQGRLADLRDELLATHGAWKANPLRLSNPTGVAAGPHETVPGHVMPIVHGLPFFSFTHQAWDAARESGALSHLPHKRLAFYSTFYEDIERLNSWQAAEHDAAVRLAPLAYDTSLEGPDRNAQLADIAAVDDNAFYLDAISRNLLDEARDQGLRPDPAKVTDWIKEARTITGTCIKDVTI